MIYQEIGGVTEIIDAFRPIVNDLGFMVYDDPELNGIPVRANYTTFAEGPVNELL